MKNENIVWHNHAVDKSIRAYMKKQRPCLLWFTGLSGSGKSTIAGAVESMLAERLQHTYLMDGDNVRHRLCGDLGFSEEDRIENIRRVGEVAHLMVDAGLIVLTAFISPFKSNREMVRQMLSGGEFIEVHIDTPIDVCETRDPKGLYKKARAGEIKDFTGIDSPYEAPEAAEICIKNDNISIQDAAQQVIDYLDQHGYLKPVKEGSDAIIG
ncbi:adenylyl-sulfate kinase [Oceanobacter sp. 5_MG-2023]|uniref:adenylyl-sulfate kinase n=1 Tax=Oceanobacter sp. 5_MG-2023 TaxID=3062645 RepID=UPI0026E2E60A|nr:adenylyl-sulfate kinase [Oceanobacter sp. 5_MG-2023]MDO6681321.1 adenylyl-sulfate kinase [Oceanobacter sp. 5_MG-2023]